MNKLHEFYTNNLELSREDKVKYYLFLPQLKSYKCDELAELLHYSNNSIFNVDGENIVVTTSSSFMKHKALLENYDWLVMMHNHYEVLDKCVVTIRPTNTKAYTEFMKSRYSKMYSNPEVLLKPYVTLGNDLSKMKATRIVKVLSHAKDYQEFLEKYLNLSKGILNDIELDSKI